MTAELARIHVAELPVSRFVEEIVPANRPVIVTGALDSWNLDAHWTPAALNRVVGEQAVQVYNNYFDLQGLSTLSKYFEQYFGREPSSDTAAVLPYVRWYTKFRDVKFFWGDAAMKRLAPLWSAPAFLPTSGYALPYAPHPATANPVVDPFPAKGLFISPQGARTSLHVDPWGSCAVLCQLYGRKRWFFYAPDQEEYLRDANGSGLVDLAAPDLGRFPRYREAQLAAECSLHAGEIMYVPHGWFHEVHGETDSISLTWNFVHSSTGAHLQEWLNRDLSDSDRSVLRFFYKGEKGADIRSHALQLLQQQAH
jgi:Cupin-like domain